jgi:hypothetical protein
MLKPTLDRIRRLREALEAGVPRPVEEPDMRIYIPWNRRANAILGERPGYAVVIYDPTNPSATGFRRGFSSPGLPIELAGD